ncbi:MAG TPA: phosphotransferase, partial [Acidimicrobiales bacterium]|nr:phosphotransferase [Acidimicrobiales bacterium]
RSYFLKQGFGDDGAATVAHEARIYRMLSTHGALLRYLPAFYMYDPDEGVLAIEAVDEARDLREYHRQARRFPIGLAGWVGRMLGTLHRVTALDVNGPAGELDPGGAPWMTSIHRPHLGVFRDSSSASLDLIRVVQNADDFGALLEQVQAGWRVSALLHSDVKWDNLLACRRGGSGRVTGLKVVDWEIAIAGDPGWDIGSAFASYISAWLWSIPVTGEHPPERFVELARHPLTAMQPAIGRCWSEYVDALGVDRREAGRRLTRAVDLAAVRVVQTAFEAAQTANRLTSNVALHLQVAHNMLRRPREAAGHLLGSPAWQPARRPA